VVDQGVEASQITRSTRDRADFQRRLQAWFVARLPAGSEPRIESLVAPEANGMSSETLLLDVSWAAEGRRDTHRLVARVAPEPTAVPVFPVYDLQRQFDIIRKVEEKTSVPVPRTFWSEPDPTAVGTPFFVMERIDGLVPPDNMPYTFGSWLTEASPEQRSRLQAASVDVLTRIHAIADPEREFPYLAPDRDSDPSALRRHVRGEYEYYRWAGEGESVPVLDECFAWLEEHWPASEGDAVLNWGDARIGNMMFRDFEPVAVLDWEMAALGPREIDLGWFIFLHRFFNELATGYGLPGMPGFLEQDEVAARYEQVSGYTPRDLEFFITYAAVRFGIVMSRTQRRSIHFGEAERPADPNDLILHRATLEKMLAGTYWS